MERGLSRQTVFVELMDSGEFTATAPGGSEELLLELRISGSWLTTSSAAPPTRSAAGPASARDQWHESRRGERGAQPDAGQLNGFCAGWRQP